MGFSSLQKFSVAIPVLLAAAPPQLPGQNPRIEAVRVDTAPRIDGRLDEEVWKTAKPVTGFRQHEPDEGELASQRTEVRIAFDSRRLFVAFRCFDTNPEEIRRTVLRRDGNFRADDHVSVLLDPFGRERDGFAFLVNANGSKVDGKLSARNYEPDRNWDAIWNAAAQVDEEGWTAEISIPFRSLNFEPEQLLWRINFGRWIPRRQEQARWTAASRNRGAFRLQDSGELTGLDGLEKGLGLDLSPYVSTRWDDASGRIEFDAGFDAFYQITPSMTATLTVNTDFAETEVDARRVNLTRFPLFFPEKRDFFIEGAEFFEFDTISRGMFRPFHSRTIGLSSGGEKIDIIGGGKLTGRAGKLGVGVLGTRLADFQDLEEDDAFVGRFTYDIFQESQIGLIATHGDPRQNLDNTLVGADLNLKNSHVAGDNVVTAKIWGMATDDAGVSGEAFGGIIRGINDPFAFLIEGEQVDDAFRPAMGFLSQTGRRGRTFVRYRFRPESDWLQWYQLQTDHLVHFTNESEVESTKIGPLAIQALTRRGDGFFFAVENFREVLFEDFNIRPGVTIPTGDYRFQTARFSLRTTESRAVQLFLNGTFGEFFDGERLQLNPGLNWSQSRFFHLNLGASYNDVGLPGGDFETIVGSAGFRLTPSARLSWSTLAQWDSVSDQIGINSRVRWIVKPGQDVFFVVNQGYDLIDGNLRSTRTETIAKVGMTIRF